MNCHRCGSDHIQKATVIVAGETHYSRSRGSGTVNGQSVTIWQNVTSQSARAQALTTDEPRRASWKTNMLAFSLMFVALVSICVAWWSFATSLVIWATLILTAVIVGRLLKRGYNLRYLSWYTNQLDRRYYCNNCGTIFQIQKPVKNIERGCYKSTTAHATSSDLMDQTHVIAEVIASGPFPAALYWQRSRSSSTLEGPKEGRASAKLIKHGETGGQGSMFCKRPIKYSQPSRWLWRNT